MASDCPPALQALRVVLLGKAGAVKSQVARALLGGKGPKGESGMCILREGEAAGKTMYVVDTPGWCRIDIHRTSEKIKKEIGRSVTLCPPGPHALILVLPVTSLDEVPPVKELKTASRHIKLLSDSNRVWKHTMVLFWCDRDVEESVIDEHIKKAGELLENCNGRYYVLRNMDSETQVHGLIQKIEDMVEDNCGDFFLPQIYQELIVTKIPKDMVDLQRMYEDREEQLKQAYLKRLSVYKTQQVEGTGLKQRRSSVDGTRPSLTEGEPTVDIAEIKKKYRDEMLTLLRHYLKPATVVLLAVIGALVGSVVGSVFGVMGSGAGIVMGIIISLPLSLWLIDASSIARRSFITPPDTKDSSPS